MQEQASPSTSQIVINNEEIDLREPDKACQDYCRFPSAQCTTLLGMIETKVISILIQGPDTSKETSLLECLKQEYPYVKMQDGDGLYYRFDFYAESQSKKGHFYKVKFKFHTSTSWKSMEILMKGESCQFDMIIYCFDARSEDYREGMKAIEYYTEFNESEECKKKIDLMALVNYCDLANERKMHTDEMLKFSEDCGVSLVEVSSLNHVNLKFFID